jgi:hypothetical protein
MRVRPLIAGLLILVAVGFAGCSDDDNNNNPTPPALTAEIAAPATTTTGAIVTLIATASPAGSGYTYAWTASGGILRAAGNDTTQWVAPDDDGTYEISVVIGDGTKSATTKKSIVASNYVAAVEPHYVGGETCKTCHNAVHQNWAATGHAGALATLVAEGMGGNTFCLPCHTVGYNTSIANGGFDEQTVPRLANVQCENCHGPGSAHAGNPSVVKPPKSVEASLCGSCHEGEHHPTYSEWDESGHGSILENPEMVGEAARAACAKCHNGAVAKDYLNDPVNFVPPTSAPTDTLDITCVVCHDAHGNDNKSNLRNAVLDVALPDGVHPEAGAGRLCIACHNQRRTPSDIEGQINDGTSRLGPHHSVQGDMLAGSGAYEAVNPAFSFATSKHVMIQDGCISCHNHHIPFAPGVPAYTGHEFKPVKEACQPCHGTLDSFESVAAKDDYDGDGQVEGVQLEVKGLMFALAETIVEATPADSTADRATLQAALPANEDEAWDGFIGAVGPAANSTRDQRMAAYNLAFVAYDQSKGVHNAVYSIQLLQQSALALNTGKLEHAKILVE